MTKLIGVPEVLAHLRDVVAKKGADYVYRRETCRYAVSGAPSCIVGHVYARLGLLDKDTQESIVKAKGLHVGKIASLARQVLQTAQEVQDGRYPPFVPRGTWGEALAAAEAESTRASA